MVVKSLAAFAEENLKNGDFMLAKAFIKHKKSEIVLDE